MTLAAPPGERLFERPQASISAAKSRFALVLLICFLLHAIPISLVIYLERSHDPAPQEQEIPVEVIVEPPPQQQPDPPEPKPESKSEQPQKQPTLDENIATDAPRAPNDEKLMKDAEDEASHAPKATPGADPVKLKPADGSAQAPENTAAAKPTEASAPQPMDHRDDGDPVEAAKLRNADTSEPAKAAQQPQTQQNAAQDPMAAFAAMPDFSFAPASKYTAAAAGKAPSTYLSIVYGMVLSHLRAPEGATGRPNALGVINFDVDFSGRLLRARIVKSSGWPALDAAALASVRAAAPFPPTPTGAGLNLNLRYGK